MDEKQLSIESIYSGPKTVLFQIRLQQSLYESLERESQARNLPISELVREYVIFQLLPKDLAHQVEKGAAIAESEAVLDGVKEYYIDLSKMLQEIEIVRRRAKAMQQTIRLIEKQVEPIFKKLFEEKLSKMKLLAEQNEKARQLRKKQRGAAGIREPDAPIFLTEDQKSTLSPKQKREREFAKLD